MKVHAPELNLCDCHGFIFIYMVHLMNDFALLWLENITEKRNVLYVYIILTKCNPKKS